MVNPNLITKQFPKTIQRAWTTGDLRSYLESKYSWDSTICDHIDWFSFGRGILKLTRHQQHWATKFLHRWLPLLGENHQHNVTKQCPICTEANKTHEHFIQCTHNKEKMNTLADKISRILNKFNIDPILRSLMRRALTHQPNTTEELCKLPNFPLATYMPLIREQDSIGWMMIHQGRMGLQWDRFQRRYQASQGINISSTEPAWLQHTIHAILQFHYKRWVARCDHLHNNTQKVKWQHQLLFQRIQGLYSYKDRMMAQDRHCFNTPIDEWKNQSVHELKTWIIIHEGYIMRCAKLADDHHARCTSDLRQYGFQGRSTVIRDTPKRAKTSRHTITERITHYFRHRVVHRAKQTTSNEEERPDHVPVQTSLFKFFRGNASQKHSRQSNRIPYITPDEITEPIEAIADEACIGLCDNGKEKPKAIYDRHSSPCSGDWSDGMREDQFKRDLARRNISATTGMENVQYTNSLVTSSDTAMSENGRSQINQANQYTEFQHAKDNAYSNTVLNKRSLDFSTLRNQSWIHPMNHVNDKRYDCFQVKAPKEIDTDQRATDNDAIIDNMCDQSTPNDEQCIEVDATSKYTPSVTRQDLDGSASFTKPDTEFMTHEFHGATHPNWTRDNNHQYILKGTGEDAEALSNVEMTDSTRMRTVHEQPRKEDNLNEPCDSTDGTQDDQLNIDPKGSNTSAPTGKKVTHYILKNTTAFSLIADTYDYGRGQLDKSDQQTEFHHPQGDAYANALPNKRNMALSTSENQIWTQPTKYASSKDNQRMTQRIQWNQKNHKYSSILQANSSINISRKGLEGSESSKPKTESILPELNEAIHPNRNRANNHQCEINRAQATGTKEHSISHAQLKGCNKKHHVDEQPRTCNIMKATASHAGELGSESIEELDKTYTQKSSQTNGTTHESRQQYIPRRREHVVHGNNNKQTTLARPNIVYGTLPSAKNQENQQEVRCDNQNDDMTIGTNKERNLTMRTDHRELMRRNNHVAIPPNELSKKIVSHNTSTPKKREKSKILARSDECQNIRNDEEEIELRAEQYGETSMMNRIVRQMQMLRTVASPENDHIRTKSPDNLETENGREPDQTRAKRKNIRKIYTQDVHTKRVDKILYKQKFPP